MTPADREAARAAYATGRGTYARLDQIRSAEDAAADILELWSAAEAAMRAMLGGSTLTGQALVRELRTRNAIQLEQANALAAFWDARSRADSVTYKPTLTDVGYARAGYNELGRAIDQPMVVPSGTTNAKVEEESRVPAAPSIEMPTYATPPSTNRTSKLSIPLIASAAVAVLALAGIIGYVMFRGSSYDRALSEGVDHMNSGRAEAARSAFSIATRERPDEAEPHVFLARLSRNEGDVTTARRELETAIRNEPKLGIAQREMGLLLLKQGDPELARRFFVRAVQYDPKDLSAQGHLGCSLVLLGRVEEGQRFMSRAGTGTWSSCRPSTSTAGAILPIQ